VIGPPRDDTALLSEINAAILACWQNGQIPAVLQRYGLWNATQQRRGLLTDSQGNFVLDPPPGDSAAVPETSTLNGGTVRYLQRIPFLLHGAAMTVFLSVTAMPLAIAAGLLIAVGRLYGPALLRYPLCWYVEVMRGTPLVLQLYFIFFLLPELGLTLPAIGAAILGLSMNYAAYEAEIYRAGLQAIPRGQMEAALSLGMSRGMALRRIIIPQAVRVMIPPVTNDFIALFKDTAVCSVITVVELSKEYYIHAQSTGAVVELGIVTAIFYLAMSYPLTLLVRTLEERLAGGKAHA
jgi:polar amino acid transport system substrate-binding protein